MARTKSNRPGVRLNKASFVRQHAERHSLLTRKTAKRPVRKLDVAKAEGEIMRALDSIVRETVAGNSIVITGFGVIEPVTRPRRNARNPQTGELVKVPESQDVRFVPGENFTMLLNGQRRLPRKGVISVRKAPKGSTQSVTTLRRATARKTAAASK